MKKPSVKNLTPEQKRAMLARLLEQKSAVCKTAFVLQGLYTICAMYNTPAWHMRSTIRFFDRIDPELLRSRMQKVIDRHPALRTTYHVPEERGIEFLGKILTLQIDAAEFWEVCHEAIIEQRVHPKHTLQFKLVDARGWSAEQLREQLMTDALEPYELDKLPVCRLRLYQREEDDVMQFDIHHCAADLWSLEIIMSELENPPTEPVPAAFPEFCAWQHAWWALPKAQEMRQWWAQELDGCPSIALARSDDNDSASFISFHLEKDLVARAREVSRQHRATLFNLVLSTMQVAVSRMLGGEDFALGGAVANRPNQRFEQTVGFFAQLVLYRRNLAEVSTWRELWEKNRVTIGEVLKRQFYPVTTTMPAPRTDIWLMFQQYQKARWIEQGAPQGDSLGLRSGGVVDSPLGPWEFLFVEPPYLSAPVMLEIVEQKDGMQGNLRFRDPCLTSEQAKSLAAEFQACFQASVTDPGGGVRS